MKTRSMNIFASLVIDAHCTSVLSNFYTRKVYLTIKCVCVCVYLTLDESSFVINIINNLYISIVFLF